MNPSVPQIPYPLTSPQREIWFDQMLHETVPLYNIGGYVKIPGRIDSALFEQAINWLIQKHDALRTILTAAEDDDGVPLQTFIETLSVSMRVQDFSRNDDAEQAALAWMQARFQEAFELTGQPLFRYDLVKTSDECYYWLMQYHHLIADGQAVALLHRSLADLYTQLTQGQTPDLTSLSYTDYISNDRAYVESEQFEQQRRYWLKQYPTVPEPLLNPRYRSHFDENLIGSGCEAFFLPRDVYQQLNDLAKQHKVTFLHIMLGTLYVYFTRIAQRDDFALGLPVLNRANAQFKQMAGLFVGLSPTWFNFGQDLNFSELIVKIQQQLKSHYRHQRFPISELNRDVGLDKTGRSALFDINLSYQHFDYDTEFKGITSHLTLLWQRWEQMPLIIHVQDFHAQADVKLDFVYNLAYFTQAEIQALQSRLMMILQTVLTDCSTSIRDFPILTASEIHQLQTWNQTQTDYPKELTLVTLFEQQVAKTPDNIAVVFEKEQVSYQRLNEKANQLAHHLLTHPALNALHNPLIAICVERSLEMVIGLLGILKAGGAYVPIDPTYPAERIDYMLKNSVSPVLLTQSRLKAQLPNTESMLICLDEIHFGSQLTDNPPLQSQPNDLTYVIYTSGSTGKPKGVMVEQQGLTNFLYDMQQLIQFTVDDKLLAISSLSFDIAAFELYLPLISGSQIYLVDQTTASDTFALQQQLLNQHITCMQATPATWQLLRQGNWQAQQPLTILSGGEALPPDLGNYLLENSRQLWNLYGPTEATICSSSYLIKKALNAHPPIGQPIANTRIYILNAQQHLQPLDIPGELCVAGEGLTRGYLNRPELTAEKFIEVELFGKQERIYKTGDLARWLPDGNLEFLGRIDNQVKLRGFRIELGEIEAVLSQHDAVKDVAVIVHQTDNNKRLVVYMTVNDQQLSVNHEQSSVCSQLISDNSLLISELRNWLKTRLPDYMVPAHWQVLNALPLTPNGKIDRKTLEKRATEENFTLETTGYIAPRTAEEKLLAKIWADVLGIERVGIYDNFFELGGHSLLATQIVSRIREAFKIELSIRTLFDKPQFGAFAETIQMAKGHVQVSDQAYPLSSPQREIWFDQMLHETIPLYNIAGYVKILGRINPALFEQAINLLIQKHDILRTILTKAEYDDGLPLQTFIETLSVSMRVQDFSRNDDAEQAALAWMQARFQEAFELTGQPLFRYDLVKTSDECYYWLMQYHHLIADGQAVALLHRSLADLYTQLTQGQTPDLTSLSYTDYISNDRAYVESEQFEQQRRYWLKQYPTVPEPLLNPRYRSHFADNLIGSGCEAFLLPRDVYQQLNDLAKQQKVSFLHIMLGTLYVYFTRIAQRDDFALGLPILNRANAQFKQMAGLFVGISPTWFHFGQDLNFSELVVKIQQQLKSHYRHQRFPISELNREVGLDKTGRSALFDINLSYQHFDYDTEFNSIKSHLTVLWATWEQTPLIIHVQDFHVQADVKLDFVYNLAYFTQAEIQALQNRLMTILQTVLTDYSTSICDFPLFTASEIHQLQTWNQTQTDYPKELTFVMLFERQVAKTPDNLAVVFEKEQLSYQRLNEKANQLAHHLLTHPALDALHNPLIAICVERSLEMMIGILGILKLGGAYVPIDPNYPAERIAYMLNDSAAPVMLTHSQLKARLPDTEAALVSLDEINFASLAQDNLDLQNQPDNLAYVIYTSGSTGQPKGTAIYHRGLLNLLNWYCKAINLSANDKTLIISALGFDLTQKNLLAPLTIGASIYVPHFIEYEPDQVVELIAQAGITWINCAPSAFYPLLETSRGLDWRPLASLRWIILGGEPIQLTLLKDWFNHDKSKTTLINSYGPTECTDVSSAYVVEKAEMNTVPIGQPIANTRIYILDKRQQPLPQGIPGELCIAGDGLAYGYLNRPELTAEKFIEADLFGTRERLYKTGDLARWLPDGNLEFLGRIDNQVKIRGFRIERGEIEAVLSQHDIVKDVAVIKHETDNHTCLVAYLIVNSQPLTMNREQSTINNQLITNNASLITELRDWLKTRLPDYMVPAHWQMLNALPLTPNGKIDRKALEKRAAEDNLQIQTVHFVAPRSTEEEILANIWIDVLGIERVGVHDNFFELGGHSLLATQVISRIRDSLSVELSLRILFEKPQLAVLAKTLKTLKGSGQLPTITIQSNNEAKVLSFGQEWFWLLSQYDSQNQAHNMFYAWQLSGALKIDILRCVACDLVERHQSLRLYFPELDGRVAVQELPGYDPLTISDLSAAQSEQELKIEVQQQSQYIFDLKTGPLFKLHLVKLAERQHLLFMTVHHIIFDGWSSGILLAEFRQRYTAYHQQHALHLPIPEVQYTDFAAWQRACLQGDVLKNQLDYWVNQLQDAPECLKLPIDYPRPEIQRNQGGIVNLQIPKALLEPLKRLARQHNGSLQMVLFSAFVLLLQRYSGQNDICVGVPRVMRHQPQTEKMLGLFLNLLVLRTQVSPQARFIDLLQQVRQQALDAYAHQDIPFEYLINQLQPQRSTAYNPYFQVIFNLINVPDKPELSLPELDMRPWSAGENEHAISNLDIVLTLMESTTGLEGSILFDKALFKPETIEYWREGFLHLLEQVVQQSDAPLSQFVLSHRTTARYPLTSSQREIWFDQMLHEEIPLYNIGGYVHIPGRIEPQQFKQAVNLLVQKHDTLRTLLINERDEDGIPLQTYAESLNVDVPLHDFSNAENPEPAALAWMLARFKEPFTLIEQPLFRYDLLKTSDDSYYWLLQYHHLITDGWGVALLNRSLAEIYTQLVNGENPNLNSPSYVGFIDNDRDYIESGLFETQQQYWLEKYPIVPEALLTPRYRARFNRDLVESECEALYLSRDFYTQLNRLAKQHQATLFHVLLGALYTYFTRTAQRDDFAIGLPVLNRPKAQFKETAGLFTGVSPTWFKCGQDLSFAELLRQIQKTLKANYRHQRFPISELNQAAGIEQNRSQLFDINLSYENHDYDAKFDPFNSHFTAMLHDWEQVPLMIFVRDFHAQAEVKFDFVYNLAYFTQTEIQALQNRFVMILQAVLTEPTALIRDLPILTEQDTQQLQTWNRTETDYPKDLTIVALFEQQVAQTPDNIAVAFEQEQLTYRQLNQKANQLAHYLLVQASLKNSHNPLIAICVERSLEMLIGLLAVLKAGGAYVPIDPNYPAERIAYMLKDSAAPVLLTQSKLQAQLPETKSTLLYLDKTDLASQAQHNPRLQSQPNDLAYVIYTSGSTGQPKGVMIKHCSISRFTQNSAETLYGISAQDKVLQFASFSFDAAAEEIYPALTQGATLVLRTPEMLNTMETFLNVCAAQRITVLDLPTAYWQQLLNEDAIEQLWPNTIRLLIIGGEAATQSAVEHWHKKLSHRTRLINTYGPTETTVVVTTFTFASNNPHLPIGKPIPDTRIYLLDARHQPQPIGIPGELCVAGTGLAGGYLNRPELTAEKFIEVELFGKKERLYKTGDLARWLPDGNLEYLGRIDHQIKLRGFRIELGEIENVLSQHESIKEAAVTLYKSDNNKHLAAYITINREQLGEQLTMHTQLITDNCSLITEWRDYLKNRLPDYMLPASFTMLDKLPLTVNGKIDRQALPAPHIQHHNAFEAPRNTIENQLTTIWKKILNQDEISIHDNFFSLGGDSILSIQIVAQARQIGLTFTPRTLFEHQTIAELARATSTTVNIEAEQGLVMGEVPLTPIQEWFLTTDFPEYWHYNQSVLLQAPQDLSAEALQPAFAGVLTHHDALRLRYVPKDGTWQQRFAEMSDTLPFSIEDLSHNADIDQALLQRTEYYQTSLNLSEGPLTRLVLFKLPDSVRLFWCIHHLIVDGVSWRILFEDLSTAYQQALTSQTIQLPNKTSSFKAWAQRLSVYAQSETVQQELSYWQNLPVHPLPVDKPNGQNRLEYSQHYPIEFDAKTTQALLQETTTAYNTQINDILLAALALSLQDWTSNRHSTIDLETHGRVELFQEIDLSRTVGWFTSIHPVTLTLPLEADLGKTIKTVQAQRQSIPHEGIGHGLLTYLRGESLPKGDILFNYLGQFAQDAQGQLFHFATETTYPSISQRGQRDHLIEINGLVNQGQLQFTWISSQDCYHSATRFMQSTLKCA